MTITFSTEQARGGPLDGAGRQAEPESGPPSPEIVVPYSNRWNRRLRSRAVLRRRDMEIRAYVGPNGSGKSACAVRDLLPTLRGERWECDEEDHLHTQRGVTSGLRLVLSTVKITLPDGTPHPLYRRLDDWRMVLEAEHCDLLFDEVTGIANARDSMGLPRQVQVILDQLRKRDVTLSFTAPSFARADNTLRTTAIGISECRGYMAKRSGGATVSAWKQKRLFRVRTFWAVDFSEWTDGKKDRLRPAVVEWWWGPGSEVFSSYSSRGSVARLGQANDSGLCLDCGGRRVAPKCTCGS